MIEEIIKKETWDENDINILLKDIDHLPEDVLIRLGIKQPAPENMFIEVPKKKGRKKINK